MLTNCNLLPLIEFGDCKWPLEVPILGAREREREIERCWLARFLQYASLAGQRWIINHDSWRSLVIGAACNR